MDDCACHLCSEHRDRIEYEAENAALKRRVAELERKLYEARQGAAMVHGSEVEE